jgi:carboxypeptidase family protein/ankyrin repeat protein
MAPKHFLNNLTIPSPCTEDWNSMTGNDEVRFCKHCNLDVHNLSQMTRSQAQRLVGRSNGRLCVRYHQDPTGRPLMLPVRQRLHRIGRRASRLAAGAFTATLSVTSAVAQNSPSCKSGLLNPPATQASVRWGLGSSVVGTITDQNGAVIPGATISVMNQETKQTLYTSTDFTGEFRIDGLEGGSYTLSIAAPGFGTTETNIYLQASDETRMNFSLGVAGLEENVNVDRTSATTDVGVAGAIAFIAPEDPFIRAAQEDNMELLSSLISGKDVNLRDLRSGTTALEHAVQNANREMVQTLLDAGANVNAANAAGETALMMLDSDATSDLVWDLINAGADVNGRDKGGTTALMRAAGSDSLEALRTLLDAGAKVDLKNNDGMTALMFAASEGSVNPARVLVLAGADLNAIDKKNKNALAYAAENDHTKVVRFLKSKGAFETVAKVEEDR